MLITYIIKNWVISKRENHTDSEISSILLKLLSFWSANVKWMHAKLQHRLVSNNTCRQRSFLCASGCITCFVSGLQVPGWSVFSERGKQLGETERKCPAAKACMYSEWLFQAFPKVLFLNLALLECAISSCSVTADRGTFFQRVTKQNLLSESSLWHPTF